MFGFVGVFQTKTIKRHFLNQMLHTYHPDYTPLQPQGWNTIRTQALKNFSPKEFQFLVHKKCFRWDLKVYEKWLQMEKVFLASEGIFPSFFLGNGGWREKVRAGVWVLNGSVGRNFCYVSFYRSAFSLLQFFVVMKFSFLLHIYNVGVCKEWE